MRGGVQIDMATGAGLIACPRCDALYQETEPATGQRLRCQRCNAVLATSRAGSLSHVIALAVTSVVLMAAAVFFPFLEISRMGFGNQTSIFGVALAFSHGFMLPLTLALLATIIGLPVLRAALILYVVGPLALGRAPPRHAARAFRLSEEMRPWSMAEIFVIGTAVAMVKLAGMASVSLGPAFWAFCALILVNIASRVFMSATTIWDAIEDAGHRTDGREVRGPADPEAARIQS
ncbi:paraquat-inducible protein A [Paracoccus suum]|uniref:Paraquat-inducible protein A n=1 Tax=Paracoccus suum TaxID=2259340 RepID=A0A344PHN1_9RHOB|nr:paraquat-inducible protein A [Paracoccus suum]AXC48886.1 paraquat-inducible protein A [Paracoccus suum]